MKRTLSFMVMALAVLLTQCRKPEVKFPSPVAPEGTTVSMTVTAGPGSKTDINTETGAITWSTGDKLYVGDGTKYVGYLTLQGAGGSATGTFSGDVTLTGITEGVAQTFHFFYLGSGDYTSLKKGSSTSVEVDFSSQNIYAEDGKLQNASAQHVGYGSAKGTVKDGVVTGINVTLVSKVALARFSFKKGGTGYSNALTLSGTNIYNKMTVNFGANDFSFSGTNGDISLTNETSSEKYVMLVPVGTESETLSFAGDGFEGSTTLGSGIESNKFYGRDGAIEVKPTPKFTVGMDGATPRTVEFAPGNLYYNGADDAKMNETLPSGWNFYGHQWDCYPSGTTSVTASNEISLFTWGHGTWSTVYDTKTYQTGSGVTMTDWGSVAIGSDPAGTWRTLTDDEWKNLLGIGGAASPRENAASLRAMVTLTDVNVYGLVILPDGSTVTASNVTTTDLVASSGAVFLPAAGSRSGKDLFGVGLGGLCWSSTCFGSEYAYRVLFDSGGVVADRVNRSGGNAVRLVR